MLSFDRLLLATRNPGKIAEFSELLQPLGCKLLSLDDCGIEGEPVENGDSFEENSRIKAEFAFKKSGIVSIADDSGLCVDALDGAPGIHSARYFDGKPRNQMEFLLKKLQNTENRDAKFICVLTCVLADGESFSVRGECCGSIARQAIGDKGFGYDPIFIVENGQTMAALSSDRKNEISHRTVAVRKFMEIIKERTNGRQTTRNP